MKGILTIIISLIYVYTFSQTIFSSNGKYGLLDINEEMIIPAKYDNIDMSTFIDKNLGYHLFILKENNKYSFTLKEYWETREFSDQYPSSRIDSINWIFNEDIYDTLYLLAKTVEDYRLPHYFKKDVYTRKGIIKDDFSQYRTYDVLCYRKNGKYGIITIEHYRKQIEKIHRPKKTIFDSDYDYSKIIYSLSNLKIYPEKYDYPIPINPSNDLIISKDNKYGILRLNYHFEIPAQFDSIPIRLTDFFYAVKKDDLWGVVFLNEYDSIPNEIFPFKYKTLQHIKNGYRYLSFYKRNSGKIYPACVYLTDINTPLRLKFIIGRRYAGDKKENVKIIDFIPKINDSEIIQSENHEYVIATNYSYDTEYKDSKNPTLFIFPIERPSEQEDRIIYQKDFVYGLYDSYDMEYYFHKKGMKSLLTYRIKDNDTFVLLNEFKEEGNVTYNIFDKSIGWNTGWVIKETTLKNNSYKYEIYNYSGEILYDITSKYQIAKLQEPSYSPAEPIVTFYSEPQKNGKRKRICMYNYEKRKFKK